MSLIEVSHLRKEYPNACPLKDVNAKVEEGSIELPLFSGFRYFDTYNSMITALESGNIGAINVDEYNIDMMSASGHKFYGPKGIGFLYIRTGVKIRSFVHGGAQERKRRAGTENVPGIIGMAKQYVDNL